MPETQTISVEIAAEILKVSPRTVRRYAKEHKLGNSYVQGKYGQELRLNEEEVRSMVRPISTGAGEGRQHTSANSVNGSEPTLPLDAGTLWKSYEALQKEYRDVAAQMGYWRAKAEEIPKLTERAESLLKEKDEVDQTRAGLEEQLTKEKAERERLKRQLRINQITFYTVIVIAAIVLLLLSPLATIITTALSSH